MAENTRSIESVSVSGLPPDDASRKHKLVVVVKLDDGTRHEMRLERAGGEFARSVDALGRVQNDHGFAAETVERDGHPLMRRIEKDYRVMMQARELELLGGFKESLDAAVEFLRADYEQGDETHAVQSAPGEVAPGEAG